ncbi:lipase family protein [Haloechinothrix sp. LS1_15]|uniref:lipase family protein n=1 Tax=Haloechinothrix sp. LS1_15 TaxID=2652248 RepID=UPI002945C664|nr:lipase family protein [Haloechinothrix sp. LS1_15]MDV6011451.1 lipase [Haloechinothrix sp. LS1_15]
MLLSLQVTSSAASALEEPAGLTDRASLPNPQHESADFYRPPSPLPEGGPGEIIRSRPSSAGPRSAQALAEAWQVMYHSTDALGEPNAVTGTVLVPRDVPGEEVPIVALAPGTHGPAARCAPSGMIDAGAYYEQNPLNELLRSGYAVAVPDYEGYYEGGGTTYLAGRAMGAATLDVLRAAQRLPEAGLGENVPVAVRGYSQGGAAAMWAGEMHSGYAGELDLVGVVGGGVPADLVEVALPLDGTWGFGVLAYGLIGLDNAYPELDLDSYLNEEGRTAFDEMRADACTFELLTRYAGDRIADYTERSPVLRPDWLARIEENALGAGSIDVPVYLYHATNDDLVAFGQARSLRDTYCDQGMDVRWEEYEVDSPAPHITMINVADAGVRAFLAELFAGNPVTDGC